MKSGRALIIALVGLVFAALIFYLAAYFWIMPHIHDQTLRQFSTPFLNVSLPSNTHEIDRIIKVGQQSGGNINECDYLAAFLLKTTLSKSDLQGYYASHYSGKSRVQFYWLNELHGSGIGVINPSGIPTFDDWVNYRSKASGANVIVYIMEAALTSSVDPRCSGPLGI
jgi:hypothetical protein